MSDKTQTECVLEKLEEAGSRGVDARDFPVGFPIRSRVSNKDWVIERYGERFYRTFYLYLSGGIAAFRSGNYQLIMLRFEVVK